MNMARRKIAYRKQTQNRFSMFLVTLVVLMILVVVSVKSIDLKKKLADVTAKEDQYNSLIADEEKRAEELEEFRKYTQTKKYKEEVAKDKLGLVYEGEILFKEDK